MFRWLKAPPTAWLPHPPWGSCLMSPFTVTPLCFVCTVNCDGIGCLTNMDCIRRRLTSDGAFDSLQIEQAGLFHSQSSLNRLRTFGNWIDRLRWYMSCLKPIYRRILPRATSHSQSEHDIVAYRQPWIHCDESTVHVGRFQPASQRHHVIAL